MVMVWPRTWAAMAMDDHRAGVTTPIPTLAGSVDLPDPATIARSLNRLGLQAGIEAL